MGDDEKLKPVFEEIDLIEAQMAGLNDPADVEVRISHFKSLITIFGEAVKPKCDIAVTSAEQRLVIVCEEPAQLALERFKANPNRPDLNIAKALILRIPSSLRRPSLVDAYNNATLVWQKISNVTLESLPSVSETSAVQRGLRRPQPPGI
jgi:hypothetical protein